MIPVQRERVTPPKNNIYDSSDVQRSNSDADVIGVRMVRSFKCFYRKELWNGIISFPYKGWSRVSRAEVDQKGSIVVSFFCI